MLQPTRSPRALRRLVHTAAFLLAFRAAAHAQLLDAQGVPTYPPSGMPDRIVLTWKEDPSSTQAVSWRTDGTVTQAIAELMPASSCWDGERKGTLLKGASFPLKTREYGTVMHHSVNFTGLEPGTLYNYRVKGSPGAWAEWSNFLKWRDPADSGNWSEWFQFRTAGRREEPFSFIFMGDAQTGIRSFWSRLIRAAILYKPDARFMVHAGDLISHADSDWQWGEWFSGGSWIFGSVAQVPVPGNHEYCPEEVPHYCPHVSVAGGSVLSKNWLPQFALPENGPEGSKELTYSFDYGDARIISLDSAEVDVWPTPFVNPEYEKAARERQKERAIVHQKWLRETLASSTRRWKIVSMHHTVFPSTRGHIEQLIRTYWQPVFEEYGVDLVLSGHHHNYVRKPDLVPGSKPYQGGCGTIYVVGMAGPSAVTQRYPGFGAGEGPGCEQTFQVLTVEGDRLRFEARGLTGRQVDAFQLVKEPGRGNRLIER